MNQRDNILNELQELSPAVAAIARVNVFKVPEGYFDTLSGHILLHLNDIELQASTPLNGFSVPNGYFDSLADNILSRIKKEATAKDFIETNEISALVAGIGNKNVYSVPEGYFENISDNIISGLINYAEAREETAGISELVAGIGNKNIYKVPQGYFENLSHNLTADLTHKTEVLQETGKISELVAGIGNKNIYSVPQGYFENLANELNTKRTTPAKVVNMKSRFTAFKYAAAATVTGLIGLSIFFMLNKSEVKPTAETLATIKTANEIIATNSFDKTMNSISDEAIVNFLESKGEDVEAALVASLADEKNLPDATDYLINDNTLDEILKTIDLNN